MTGTYRNGLFPFSVQRRHPLRLPLLPLSRVFEILGVERTGLELHFLFHLRIGSGRKATKTTKASHHCATLLLDEEAYGNAERANICLTVERISPLIDLLGQGNRALEPFNVRQ
jgi:hypothetical protein